MTVTADGRLGLTLDSSRVADRHAPHANPRVLARRPLWKKYDWPRLRGEVAFWIGATKGASLWEIALPAA